MMQKMARDRMRQYSKDSAKGLPAGNTKEDQLCAEVGGSVCVREWLYE